MTFCRASVAGGGGGFQVSAAPAPAQLGCFSWRFHPTPSPNTPHTIGAALPHTTPCLTLPPCCFGLPYRDQRLYVQELTAAAAAAASPAAPAAPRALTPEGKLRYADGVLDAGRSRLVVVCEDHSGEGEAVSTVAAVGE